MRLRRSCRRNEMRRILLLPIFIAACDRPADTTSYFPLTPHSQWTYQVTTAIDGEIRKSVQIIRTLDNHSHDGKPVTVRRSEIDGSIGVEYWLRETPESIVRIAQRTDLQDQAVMEPSARTVLKLPVQAGSAWAAPTVAYTILRKSEYPRELKYGNPVSMTYSVETVDDEVVVPAGTFRKCARVKGRADLTLYTDPVAGFRKVPITTTEWYCPGVGLTKLERDEPLSTSFFSGGSVQMVLMDYRIR